MITVQTTRFGLMELSKESIITIKGGIIGIPEHWDFVLVQHSEKTPFYWLQSVSSPSLALVVVNPKLFKLDYEPPLPANLLQELKADSKTEINIFTVVTVPQGRPEQMTANLLGPIIINPAQRLGKQHVLDDRVYSHCYSILK